MQGCPSAVQGASRTARGSGDDGSELSPDEDVGFEEDVDPDQREREGRQVELEPGLLDSCGERLVGVLLPAGGVPRDADDVAERRSCGLECLRDVAVDLDDLAREVPGATSSPFWSQATCPATWT